MTTSGGFWSFDWNRRASGERWLLVNDDFWYQALSSRILLSWTSVLRQWQWKRNVCHCLGFRALYNANTMKVLLKKIYHDNLRGTCDKHQVWRQCNWEWKYLRDWASSFKVNRGDTEMEHGKYLVPTDWTTAFSINSSAGIPCYFIESPRLWFLSRLSQYFIALLLSCAAKQFSQLRVIAVLGFACRLGEST